ncbi:hypothetical protein ABZW10_32945 [Kitasatospora sp. NPDC004723]|uniref:hypothetical protein n=1 Tax=Kitasatospora sp. NPDC004723 TaxID=3154288 RepID=UPI0033BCB215
MSSTLRRAATAGLLSDSRSIRSARLLGRILLAPVEAVLTAVTAAGDSLIRIGEARHIETVAQLGELLADWPGYLAELAGQQAQRLGRLDPWPWYAAGWYDQYDGDSRLFSGERVFTDEELTVYGEQLIADHGTDYEVSAEDVVAFAHALGRCSCAPGTMLADCDDYNDAMEAEELARRQKGDTFLGAVASGEIRMPRADRAAARHYEGLCACEDPTAPEVDCLDRILAAEVDHAETEAYAERDRRAVQAQHDDESRLGEAEPLLTEAELAAREVEVGERMAALAAAWDRAER